MCWCVYISDSVTKDNSEYNALEHDLAVVNLYFGASTAYGQHYLYKDVLSKVRHNNGVCRVRDLQKHDYL